jgi:hypothetical protein
VKYLWRNAGANPLPAQTKTDDQLPPSAPLAPPQPRYTACADTDLGCMSMRACLKSLRRQSSIATDRFRIRLRPFGLAAGNRSSCP